MTLNLSGLLMGLRNPLIPYGNKRSYIFKQTFVQVSMHDLFYHQAWQG